MNRRHLMALATGAMLWGTGSALWADDPTPGELNEGSKLEWDDTYSIWRYKWWGLGTRTYFIQTSDDDMQSWTWLPVVEPGADAVAEWGFSTTANRLFIRLQHTDQTSADPDNADFDQDGVTNLLEVQNGRSPLNSTDTDGDGDSDDYEIVIGGTNPNLFYNGDPEAVDVFLVAGQYQRTTPGELASLPLTFYIRDDATDKPVQNAPVSVRDEGEGYLFSDQPDGSFSSTITVRTNEAGVARVWFKAPAN